VTSPRDIAALRADHPDMASLIEAYLARTRGSAALFDRATRSLPGGSTRTTIYSAPYPPYMVRGEGLRTWDVDGNEYRDFLGNYTSLILGHAHPEVVAAVEAQVRLGSAFAAPTETEIELAEEIRRRLPSVEKLRFTNSGTEATRFALRAARAFTGRDLVAKFEDVSGLTVPAEWGVRPSRPREMLKPWMVSGPPPGWTPEVSLEEGILALLRDSATP